MNKNLLYIIAFFLLSNCQKEKFRIPLQQKSGNFIDFSVKSNIEFNKNEYIEISKFVSNSPYDFLQSDYGFWYYFNKKKNKTDYKPKFGDKIFYTFECLTLNGQKKFSINAKQLTYRMEQQDIISGLREGFKLMSEGDVTTFIFPSRLCFGLSGDEQKKINPNTSLIYKVKIHRISKNS